MRLKAQDVQKILSVLKIELKDFHYQIFLFGSRLDDNKRGGDIDLLLLVDQSDFETIHAKKAFLKFELEDALGDQRIDLTLTTHKKMAADVFIQSIAGDALLLDTNQNRTI